jgi:NitT/TauT family transport system ATP-binding protein
MDLVDLGGFEKRFPWQLSGGMQQRASIARALAFDADILLMDEPFGALDEIVRDHLNEQLLKLWARTEKTIAFVTHSIPEAVYLSTKIVVMSPRPGRITDVIDSPLPKDRPLDIRDSAEFIEISHRVRDGLRAGHVDD